MGYMGRGWSGVALDQGLSTRALVTRMGSLIGLRELGPETSFLEFLDEFIDPYGYVASSS